MRNYVNVLIAAALVLGVAIEPAKADEVNAGGMTISLPDGWSRAEVGAWTKEENGSRVASLIVSARPSHTSVTRAGLQTGKLELERASRDRGEARLLSWDLQLTKLGGEPAYRVRASQAAGEARIEQLQYVVSGKSTVALTFSSAAEDFESQRRAFEQIASTLRVRERAGLLDEMPASMCGALLGLVAGLGLAARRKRHCGAAFPSAAFPT